MACARPLCAAEKVFIFINIAFAMYAGALLATAARLAFDPSTYTWFRFLCASQYRVSAGYLLGAGLWLAVLVYLAATAIAIHAARHHNRPALHLYCIGVVCLAVSEVCYGAWMAASLAAWWRTAPQAQLARRGMDLVHDLKPALLAMQRFRDVTLPLYDMIEEVERVAPSNAFVIAIFMLVGIVLQIAALVTARRLLRPSTLSQDDEKPCELKPCESSAPPEDLEPELEPGWRRKANLRMYTILDKIF